jgi:hypothetical protein
MRTIKKTIDCFSYKYDNLIISLLPNGPAPDKSGCGADNFQYTQNENPPLAMLNVHTLIPSACHEVTTSWSASYVECVKQQFIIIYHWQSHRRDMSG